jgi:hypothetical protein
MCPFFFPEVGLARLVPRPVFQAHSPARASELSLFAGKNLASGIPKEAGLGSIGLWEPSLRAPKEKASGLEQAQERRGFGRPFCRLNWVRPCSKTQCTVPDKGTDLSQTVCLVQPHLNQGNSVPRSWVYFTPKFISYSLGDWLPKLQGRGLTHCLLVARENCFIFACKPPWRVDSLKCHKYLFTTLKYLPQECS